MSIRESESMSGPWWSVRVHDKRIEWRPSCAKCDGSGKAAPGRVCVFGVASVRQRIGANLDVHRERPRAFAKLVEPGCAVTAGTPEAAAFPAGIRVVDAPVQTLSVEAHRVRHPHQDHLSVLETDKPILEVGGRDRNVLAEPDRVVVVDPGVVARLGASVLKTFEARPRILVVCESLGAVIAGRIRPIERTLALAPVEADQSAIRARPPQHPV